MTVDLDPSAAELDERAIVIENRKVRTDWRGEFTSEGLGQSRSLSHCDTARGRGWALWVSR